MIQNSYDGIELAAMLWKFMIFKEEKNNKRDIQRPGFQSAKKSRVLPKKLRF